ncbi:Lrp/AsnC family transcriptional regulator [Candidatus Woesearchaeota archaeon]|jgi:DNA-binding Lrp family transcriptional regulator|nr:Lrp/AsnC family transcriptional regulator [Candidatus Woesearchaeota archaeon]MBT6520366.1 Lrp/AsnC family transcriptional regulator [Candidatus Woesearchaeota archaeon]MBT7368552.1 Lrp/AsnC family transcriptional regulator [Candidatus Woesearchaeota archaeon]
MNDKNKQIVQGRVIETNKSQVLLDKKDQRIILELFKNARSPISQIAKKVKLSKQVVDYRIKRMEQQNLILGYTAFLNNMAMGYEMYIAKFRLKKISKEKLEEITNFFVNHPFTKWVATCTGQWDVSIVFIAKDIFHYNTLIQEFNFKLSENLVKFRVDRFIEENVLGFDYLFKNLLNKNENRTDDINKSKANSNNKIENKIKNKNNNGAYTKIIKLDDIDKQILQILETNARTPLIKIAKQVNLSADAVNYRIKNLIKKRIIVKFIPKINVSLLHYQWYVISLYTQTSSENEFAKLMSFLKSQSNIVFIIRCPSIWNIEFDIHVKSSKDLFNLLMDLRTNFSEIIENIESTLVFYDHKYTHLPKGILNE